MRDFKSIVNITKDLLEAAPTKDDTPTSIFFKMTNLFFNLSDKYATHRYEAITKDFLPNGNILLKSILNDECVKSFTKNIYSLTDPTDFIFKTCLKEIDGVGKFFHYVDSKGNFDIQGNVFLDKSFNFDQLSQLIYEFYGLKIFVETSDRTKEYTNDAYFFSSRKQISSVTNDRIVTTSKIKEVNEVLKKSGTYLFYGKPGTGKSSFIFANEFLQKKCVKIMASDFMENDFLIHCMKILKPDILIVEELDKFSLSLGNALVFFEKIRNYDMTVVITANDISNFHQAILRPGRIDHIIEFTPPTRDDIVKIVDLYATSVDDESKNKFIDLMHESKFTHAYVTDFSKKLTSDNFENIKQYVGFLSTL